MGQGQGCRCSGTTGSSCRAALPHTCSSAFQALSAAGALTQHIAGLHVGAASAPNPCCCPCCSICRRRCESTPVVAASPELMPPEASAAAWRCSRAACRASRHHFHTCTRVPGGSGTPWSYASCHTMAALPADAAKRMTCRGSIANYWRRRGQKASQSARARRGAPCYAAHLTRAPHPPAPGRTPLASHSPGQTPCLA